MRPGLAMLLIRRNNLPSSPPENIALGIGEIVRWSHMRSAETRVLILNIRPRGAAAGEKLHQAAAEVNQWVVRCADNCTTYFTDVGRLWLDPDGVPSSEMSFGALHRSPIGYATVATALQPESTRSMGG